MKHLGLGFGVIHAIVAGTVFGSAIAYPLRASLLPVIMFCADFPFSLLFEYISKHLTSAAGSRLVLDAVLYTILGSTWFFAIGEFISRLSQPRP